MYILQWPVAFFVITGQSDIDFWSKKGVGGRTYKGEFTL
jgi:hypothetical protein